MKELDEKRKIILIKIGKTLSNKREEVGHSISRIANITKISSGTLRAIEQAKHEEFPHLVFLKGFVRNYAKLLEIDSDWMIEGLNQVYTLNEQPAEGTPVAKNFEYRNWVVLLTILLVAGGLGIGVFSLLNTSWYSNQSFEDQNIVSDSLIETDTENTSVTQSLFKMQLDLQVMERGWGRITLDQQPPIEVSLEPNRNYSWQANDQVTLTLTKGSIAQVFLNGQGHLIDPKDQDQLYTVELMNQ